MRRVTHMVLAVLLTALAIPAGAQSVETAPTGLALTTPFVGVGSQPGDTTSFAIDVAAPPGTRVALSVEGLPEGWNANIQGGGAVVDEVLTDATGHVEVTLNVTAAEGAAEGKYPFTLVGTAEASNDELALSINVTAEATGGVELTTDFPTLGGPPDDTYTFNLTLQNSTPQDIQFGLGAEAPQGWVVDVRPNSESRASNVTVEAGASAALTVEVDPLDTVEAGIYPITVRAEGGSESATAELTIDITGTYGISLTTVGEVLNMEGNAGGVSTLDLIVTNTGSAPLSGITVNAVEPSGWESSFDREIIETLGPGESVQVSAQVTVAEDAINGDYIVSFSAYTSEARSDIDIRTTVTTSAWWGVVGVGVILVALIGLSLVFRTYGRR